MRYAASFLALLTGCQLGGTEPHWTDQLDPGGPCREVNLADGLDPESTDELHALFACLNRTGNLEPLAELDSTMDARSRADEPIGLTVIGLTNRLPASGLDVFGLAGKALQVLQTNTVQADTLLHISVEAMYGRPYTTVEDSVDLMSQAELDQGLVRPALPIISALAQTILDDGDDIPELGIAMLTSDRIDDATCTLAALIDAEDPQLNEVAENLLPSLGASIESAQSPDNDRWTEASGHSLRDFIDALIRDADSNGKTSIDAMSPTLLTLLKDEELRDRLAVGLALAEARGQLDYLPAQIAHFVQVDVDGYPLAADRDSALFAGIRMLDQGNTDLICSVLGFDIELGNLSEVVVELLAEEGIDEINSLVDFLGNVLDLPLTDLVLEQIAEEGLCPPIDEQFLRDMKILERFHDDEVQELLPMTMEFLRAIHPDRGTSRVPELLEIMSIFYARGNVRPAEEFLRDQAHTQMASDAMTLIPKILNPEDLVVDSCAEGSQPLDFNTAWAIVHDTLAPSDSGENALKVLQPTTDLLLADDRTWALLEVAATLMQQADAELQAIPEMAVAALGAVDDPDETRATLVRLLQDEDLRDPVLALLESKDLMGALGRAETDAEGPLPFMARLITSEAVTVMLQTIDLVLDSLDGSDEDASG